MKILSILLLFICSFAYALDKPYPIYNYKGELNKKALIETVDDTYVRLGNTVDKTSNQSISGNKTFTGTTTISSATITNLTVTNINTGGKHWELIFSSDTYVNSQSFVATGLNGNTDTEYDVICRIKSGTATGSYYYIQPNSDSGVNYGAQYVRGDNSTASAARDSGTILFYLGVHTTANSICLSRSLLYAKTGLVRTIITTSGSDMYAGLAATAQVYIGSWSNTDDNITSLKFGSGTANGFGVGSHFEIWALR